MDIEPLKLFFAMQEVVDPLPSPAITQLIHEYGQEPYLILMATLLSLRARDTMTLPLSKKLYQLVPTPESLLAYDANKLMELLRPIGFYKKKAETLRAVCFELCKKFNGIVPRSEEALLSLPGVGRKTANLLRGELFGEPCVCVDTHVHRIANHLGFVRTTCAYETECALMKLFPQELWISINRVLVPWGQYVCRPSTKKCCCYTVAIAAIRAKAAEIKM